MWLRRLLIPLLVTALALPAALLLVIGTARLLDALGDASAALVLDRIALAGGLLWVADLVALVILQGILTAAALPGEFDLPGTDEPFPHDEQ